MDKNFLDTVYLFSCGALGITPKHIENIDIEAILQIAKKQGIFYVVFLAIKKMYSAKKIIIDVDLYECLEKSFYTAVCIQIQRQNVINNVLSELQSNDIVAYVLKGITVAQYYDEPLSRISGDTDIFVGNENILASEKIFEKCGFKVNARSPMEHHTVCEHSIGGSVDLHLTFHDDCFEEKYFFGYTKITEPPVKYTTDDGYVYNSLGITDNAIFLFLHLVKHYLSCGTGIRQIMDFLLFWKNNFNEIDICKFKKMLYDLGFTELFNACVIIGKDYLQIDKTLFKDFEIHTNETFVNFLMLDIQNGGVFGKLEHRKLTFYYLFGNNGQEVYSKSMIKDLIVRYIKTFGYSFLSKKYHYLKCCVLLLPIAYINRCVDLIRSVIRLKNTEKKANIENDEFKNIQNRIDIIKGFCGIK